MHKKYIILIIFIAIMISVLGCSNGVQEENNGNDEVKSPVQEETPEQDVEEPEKEVDPIKEQIEEMSLEEKVGQMVMVGLEGYTMDDSTKKMIEDYYVGGFILLGENIQNSQQVLKLMNDLKSTNTKNNIPLFLSVDEEGGQISRMPDEFKDIPSNRIIGQKNDKAFSYNIGSIIAEEVKSFGYNMDFAPVLDIDSNPNNPVIGDRSFGSNEKIVSELGIETMKGIRSKNIIPVAKHFPGHGDTSVDSHIGLPTVDKDIDSLMEFELVPFQEAIKNNVEGIMIAHILYDKIDSENPATLSRSIIQDLLREQLNFDGLIITDDMTMGAIMENYDIGDAVVKSVKAGSDIVLVCHGYENELKALNTLKEAVEEGELSEERIDESLYRILTIKEKYELKDEIIQDIDINKINREISKVLD